ncbi:50S ribosomal protein L33 [Bacillaceae bacterium S4-13-58]
MRKKLILACSECYQRNYSSYKNTESQPERLEVKKYCKKCEKHTLHRETK